MADTSMPNVVNTSGLYDGVTTTMESNIVTTLLVDGLTITLSADKVNWTNGELLYTAVVTNGAVNPYETPTLSDTLDTALVSFVEGSVMIDGTAAPATDVTYTPATGLLQVQLPTIAVGGSLTVTFRVSKA